MMRLAIVSATLLLSGASVDEANTPLEEEPPAEAYLRHVERKVQRHNEVCPPGQVYDTCGSACPPKCSDIFQPPWLFQICRDDDCVEGCFCPPGMVLNDEGNCIRREECPPVPDCPENLEYSNCGPMCLYSCAHPNFNCILSCRRGCFCPDGMILDYQGRCVLRSQCPPPPAPLDCPETFVYQPCGIDPDCLSLAVCPGSDLPDDPRCLFTCKPGCACPHGTVLHPNKQECVRPEDCPSLPPQTPLPPPATLDCTNAVVEPVPCRSRKFDDGVYGCRNNGRLNTRRTTCVSMSEPLLPDDDDVQCGCCDDDMDPCLQT